MIFNCINNAKEQWAWHPIFLAKHDITVQWGLGEVIIEQSTIYAFSIVIDERMHGNWTALDHLVALLIEKLLDDQVIISDSTIYRFFFFFDTIDHFRIIIIIWRGWWRWRVWWIYEIGIHFERENFWVSKVVGIACSLQWETWNASVIYKKILESMCHCIVKSVQNWLRIVRIFESICHCIVKSVHGKRENLRIMKNVLCIYPLL